LAEDRYEEIVVVQQRFVAATIPVQTFESEDRTSVAIVFERVNRLGVELNMFQLLTAWTWSEDFDLQDKFLALAEEFSEFGFADVGADNDLMLRVTASVLVNDPSPTALIDVNGSDVRQQFDTVHNALRLAIDFLRVNLYVRHLKFLPYPALLVPLASYFAERQSEGVPDSDRKVLLRWFWRTSFSHRYSGNPMRNIRADAEQARLLRRGESSTLDQNSFEIDESFFLGNYFRQANVAAKCLILMLVARQPRSFISGSRVDLEAVLAEPNRKEFHHCFPQAYLLNNEIEIDRGRINALANIAFITRVDNRTILAKSPSEYRSLMPDDIESVTGPALIPASLFDDAWDEFLTERATLLTAEARLLMNQE